MAVPISSSFEEIGPRALATSSAMARCAVFMRAVNPELNVSVIIA